MSESFGRYEVRSPLGKGAMGEVWRGHDPVLERTVAIKVLSPGRDLGPALRDQYRERFLREARAAAKLAHPGIVAVYDAGIADDGSPYVVMELVEGKSLEAALRDDGPLDPAEAARTGAALARALACAHRAGIVHRDVKPGNALRATDGTVKLVDFGIARLAESTLTAEGNFLGSPQFASPEQIKGAAVVPASDLFSLGVTVYMLLTGKSPFARARLAETARAIVEEEPGPVSLECGCDPAFDGVLARALAKDPGMRYPDGEAMAQALEALLGTAPAAAGARELDLLVVEGVDRGRRAALAGAVEIGRGAGTMALSDPSVSTRHALVEVRGGRIWLRDLASRNGTLLGGERVTEVEIAEGAVFGLGATTRVKVVPRGAGAAGAASAPATATVLEGETRPLTAPRPLGGSPRFRLRVKEGPAAGLVVAVDRSLVLGRDDGDVRLDDPRVSRKHAMVELKGLTRLVLRDLASSNGTFLGAERVREVELKPGDEFRLGGTTVAVEAG